MRERGAGIAKELTLGFLIIIFIGGAVTFAGLTLWSRHNFDALVRAGDVEIARSGAEVLSEFYGEHGSWDGVGSMFAKGLPGSIGLELPKDDHSRFHHERGPDIPVVVTDSRGFAVYPAVTPFSRLPARDGVAVLVDGKTVGYVYFKSMLQKSYSARESAFMSSLLASIVLSVLVGAVLALFLGSFFASKITRPIVRLDEAVRSLAAGDLGVRATKARDDEIGRLSDNFNAMAERLEVTELERKNLLADIAHELRTPVSIIQANLEMMIDGVYEPDRARLSGVCDETRILTELIGNLRAISDLELGIVPVSPVPVRVYSLVAETCEKCRPLFAEKNIELSLGPEPEYDVALSEEPRLRQVVRNILMNALKYAPPDSTVSVSIMHDAPRISGEVSRTPAESAGLISVSVSDQGPGVPERDLGKIFDRFYRVDSSRSRETGGRGLGLAICRQFIEACGGSIAARNNEPRGLNVRFTLPACPR